MRKFLVMFVAGIVATALVCLPSCESVSKNNSVAAGGNLEAEVSQLEAQVSMLQSQVNSLQGKQIQPAPPTNKELTGEWVKIWEFTDGCDQTTNSFTTKGNLFKVIWSFRAAVGMEPMAFFRWFLYDAEGNPDPIGCKAIEYFRPDVPKVMGVEYVFEGPGTFYFRTETNFNGGSDSWTISVWEKQ